MEEAFPFHCVINLARGQGRRFAAQGESERVGLEAVRYPAVDRKRLGGRAGLHPRYCRVVPPSPRAVAEAVAELRAHPPNPHDVRDHALRVMTEQRQRFFALGQRIYEVENTGRDFARDFYADFRHRMADWQPNRSVMEVWRRMFADTADGRSGSK